MLSEKLLEELSNLAAIDKEQFLLSLKDGENFKSDDEIALELQKSFSGRFSAIKENTVGETIRKERSKLERDLKKKFAYEGSEQGIDLIDAIINNKVEAAKANTQTSEPDKIDFSKWDKKQWFQIPAFQEVTSELTETWKKKYEDLETQTKQEKEKAQKEAHESKVFDFLTKKLITMGAKGLENEAARGKVVKSLLTDEIDPQRVQIEGDTAIFFEEDGSKKVDLTYGKLVAAEDILKTKWVLGFASVPAMNTPPPPNGKNGQGQQFTGLDTNTKAQMDKIHLDKGDMIAFLNGIKNAETAKAARSYYTDVLLK